MLRFVEMLMQKKIRLFLSLLLGLQLVGLPSLHGFAGEVQDSFQLGRVQTPTVLEIQLQKKLQAKRTMRRYAVTAGVSLSVVAVLYVASCIRYNLEEQKKLDAKSQMSDLGYSAANVFRGMSHLGASQSQAVHIQEPVAGSTLLWPVRALVSGVKRVGVSASGFGKDFAKFLADSTTILAAGVVTSAVYDHLRNQVTQAYQEETLLWFVDQQTKIRVILSDLKQRTAEYDLHGALLSQEMLSQDTRVHLKAFVTEISEAASDYKHDNVMKDYDYFAFLLGEVKKKYIQKADQLEQLQDQLAPLIAQRHRTISSLDGASLFERDEQARADIVELSRQLVFEMSKLLAFVDMHKHKHQARVKDMISTFNQYMQHVEMMLQSSPEQIAGMSKENRGIFTVTYEYERKFDQQITFLDKYCKIVTA